METMYKNMKVLVTGGTGMIGSHLIEELLRQGAAVRTVAHARETDLDGRVERLQGDLREMATCLKAVQDMEVVIHAAAVTGGSNTVVSRALSNFTDNVLMNTQILEASRRVGVKRFGFLSNSSVYPGTVDILTEDMAGGSRWAGGPENHTGLVKLLGEKQGQIYHEQANMAVTVIRGGNAYGPGDDFNLETSHVIPALIRKTAERRDPFQVWGDGTALRDFTHAADIARGLLYLMSKSVPCEPINVATGKVRSIREVVETLLRLEGYQPRVVYDTSRPPVSAAKRPSIARMEELGFRPTVLLEDGLRETLAWFKRTRLGRSR